MSKEITIFRHTSSIFSDIFLLSHMHKFLFQTLPEVMNKLRNFEQAQQQVPCSAKILKRKTFKKRCIRTFLSSLYSLQFRFFFPNELTRLKLLVYLSGFQRGSLEFQVVSPLISEHVEYCRQKKECEIWCWVLSDCERNCVNQWWVLIAFFLTSELTKSLFGNFIVYTRFEIIYRSNYCS